MNELKVKENFYSDTFSKQDEVLALFYKGQYVGGCFYRLEHASMPYLEDDSYFSYWDNASMQALSRDGENILICSFFTIDPQFRGGNHNISWKQLVVTLMAMRFINSPAHSMTGATRKSKQVHEICNRAGAEVLKENILFSGKEPMDLQVFYKGSVVNSVEYQSNALAHDIWNYSVRTFALPVEGYFERVAA